MICAAIAGIALAGAIAVGALAVPDLAGALSDATRSLGGWIYLAVAVLVFLETTALLGFMIHGELALLLGGVAAERGDASLLAMIGLVGILLATTAFTVRSRWTRRDDEQAAVRPGSEPGRPGVTPGGRDPATGGRRAG